MMEETLNSSVSSFKKAVKLTSQNSDLIISRSADPPSGSIMILSASREHNSEDLLVTRSTKASPPS